MSIRIVSYNIHGGYGLDRIHDYKRINRLLENHEIDIALLQEVDTRPAQRSTAQDIKDLRGKRFTSFVAGKTIEDQSGWYGNVIMSRFEILGHEVIDVTMPGREPRNIIEAVIKTDEGVMRVLNTHKGLNHGERCRQLEKLHTLLVREDDLPIFVGGDINEWHTSSRAMRELNTTLYSCPTGRSFPTRFPLFHLDRIWCRPFHIIQESKILKTKETKMYSDHYPVFAKVGIKKVPA